ncbi:MAG TPA: 50S ribosomal protein L5 [bacterium]|nr:50S ribosomal protein L5 [bacterium]
MSFLKEKYNQEIVPALMKKFGYKNKYQVPKLLKIVINMGVGEAITDIKILDKAVEELTKITGQKPKITKAKKAISNFKLKKNASIGCFVTLRNNMMYDFLERLLNVALPKVRDFCGLELKGFDKRGNYNFGIKEQTIFPEINPDKIDMLRGMNISVVTTAKTDDEAKELLLQIGFPFRK